MGTQASKLRGFAAAKPKVPMAAAVALLSALCLSGCTSESMTGPALVPATPTLPPIASDELVGKWGLGSFREEKDLVRTTDEARRFCNNPYVITKGPNGGVMMYLADQSAPTEVFVRTVGGRVYIGPSNQPPGGIKDRQVMSFENGVLVAGWVDPTVAARYGTMVFVKCPDGAAKPARTAAAKPAPAPAVAPAPAPAQ
jgi:hypothetical protein